MFIKEKFLKSPKGMNFKSNSNKSIPINKFHVRPYQKKKSFNKKPSFLNNNSKFKQINQQWKKRSSFSNWDNKENDKNYFNYDNNIDSVCTLHKSFQKNNYETNDYDVYLFENENYCKKKDSNKKPKKFSIDHSTTQSNSSSHEEINLNNDNEYICGNSSENNNDYISKRESIVENVGKEIDINYSHKEIIGEINKEKDILEASKSKKNKKNKKLNFSSKKLDLKRANSSKIGTSSSTLKKKDTFSKNKYDDNSFQICEQYNKFNSVNQELNIIPIINPIAENTVILTVNVKLEKNKSVIFNLRRFDDLFLTVKLFCEINSIEEKLMKPIITKVLCSLNSIYQIYNSKLDIKNIKILQMLKTISNDNTM